MQRAVDVEDLGVSRLIDMDSLFPENADLGWVDGPQKAASENAILEGYPSACKLSVRQKLLQLIVETQTRAHIGVQSKHVLRLNSRVVNRVSPLCAVIVECANEPIYIVEGASNLFRLVV